MEMRIPSELVDSLRPVTVVVGHYGAGKTNFAVNLAIDLKRAGYDVTLIDVDVVNPYFRASEQEDLLGQYGVNLVAPVFSKTGTSLDVPSLTGRISPTIRDAHEGSYVIIDAGGDDVGATALGRYALDIASKDYAMLYVANAFRNLVQDPMDALENLYEIQEASHLKATAIVNNSHLKGSTTDETVHEGVEYAKRLSSVMGLPLVCTTIPANLEVQGIASSYPVQPFVKNPWE